MLSILIPFKNDFSEIESVVQNLLATATGDLEIVIVNDGSVQGSGKFRPLELDLPYVRVINNHMSMGVGYSFDRALEASTGEIIVLMGSDVFPHEGWYDQVIEAVTSTPETLGCSVCVGDKPPYAKYYGADLLFTVGIDDLPLKSKLRERSGGYTDLFKGRWLDKQGDEPYPIPCLMGAFYFTSRKYYNKIHGWDTVAGNKFCGHKGWGHLEPYISLKSWFYGGGCTLYPNIEVTHVFNRRDSRHRFAKGVRGSDVMWWNACFALETMILTPSLHNIIYDFPNRELNLNVARKWIDKNRATVERIRDRNRLEFKYDYHIFEEKFGYSFDL